MTILSYSAETAGDAGVRPRLIRVNCDDTLATVIETGYLNGLLKAGVTFDSTDLVLVSYFEGAGLFTPSVSNNVITLHIANTYVASLAALSYTSAITAHAGGGQANATELDTVINRIATVATAADSVKLPGAAPGRQVILANVSANSCNVYPQPGESINALAANAAYALAGAKNAMFVCATSGVWHSILTA